jgi:hypothetical protein
MNLDRRASRLRQISASGCGRTRLMTPNALAFSAGF